MTASVVGTVFLVNAELRGSRVAVIQGVVRVERGGSAESLHPGEQVASSARMEARPVSEEIAWSRQAEEHLALLQQSAAPPLATTQDAKDAFEVASIRPSGPVAAGGGRGGGEASDAGPCPGSSVGSVRLQFQLDPGRLAITRLTLYHLIALAYGNRCPAPGYLSGGPDWAKSERFNLEAKIPEGTTAYTKEQLLGGNAPRLQRMLQVLLADRFKLVLKREIRQMPAYNLIVAKPGKLRSSEDQTPDALPGPAARGLAGAGLVITLPSRSAPISRFANNLQEILKMPVIDKTDLTGLYDIVLTFPELGSLPPPSQNPDPGVFDKLNEEISERLPERLPAKLEQETGLKLERTTAPMEVFVIEHAEKPAEN